MLYTIGYNRYNANVVIKTLEDRSIKKVIDVRLWTSMVGPLLNFNYVHMPKFSPSTAILTDYKQDGNWTRYESRFKALMKSRDPLKSYERSDFDEAVLICAEKSPQQCHRRLVAEMIQDKFGLEVTHL